jgi:hypothetical protein
LFNPLNSSATSGGDSLVDDFFKKLEEQVLMKRERELKKEKWKRMKEDVAKIDDNRFIKALSFGEGMASASLIMELKPNKE